MLFTAVWLSSKRCSVTNAVGYVSTSFIRVLLSILNFTFYLLYIQDKQNS